MGEETPGLENLFVQEESHHLGPPSTGLVQGPAWLTTLMRTAMARVAMNPMDTNPGVRLSGALIAPLPAMARTQPCWRPLRAARGVCGRACVCVCVCGRACVCVYVGV